MNLFAAFSQRERTYRQLLHDTVLRFRFGFSFLLPFFSLLSPFDGSSLDLVRVRVDSAGSDGGSERRRSKGTCAA